MFYFFQNKICVERNVLLQSNIVSNSAIGVCTIRNKIKLDINQLIDGTLALSFIDFLQIKHWQSIQLKIIDQIRLIFVYTVISTI